MDRGAEIFCAARAGDWTTAALLYGTADALGLLPEAQSEALLRFLDPELFEGEDPLPAPETPDALLFAIQDALGQRPRTRTWPRIYAHTDLTERAGWKDQLHAAERLAQTGALSDNRLLGLYTSRRAAASGGVWDRVTAIQQFETALRTQSTSAVSKTLPTAWAQAKKAGIATRFASLFAERLEPLVLSGPAADAAYEVLLLSPAYERAAQVFPARARTRAVLTAIASGVPSSAKASNRTQEAILAGFSPASSTAASTASEPLGLQIANALIALEAGAAGDVASLTRAIATLRSLGLEDTARRASLQILLLREPT